MTSRERILAVLNKQKPDKVPISPRIWAWILEKYGKDTFLESLDLKGKYFDYDPIIEIKPEIPNFIITQFENYSFLEKVNVDMTCESKDGKMHVRRKIHTPCGILEDVMVYPPAGKEYGIAPNSEKVEPLIKTSDDLEKIKYLLPNPRMFKLTNYELVDKVIGENGFLQVRSHMGVDHLLVDSIGFTNSLLMYYDDISLFKEALKLFHDYYKECLLYCLDRGAKMIFESWYNCSISSGWSPNIYRECFLPYIIEDAEIVHSYGAYFHFYDDGKIMPILDDLKTAKLDVISTLCPPPSGDVDAKILKSKLGGVTALNGYVDLGVIRFGKPDEVEEQVRNAIEVLGTDGGYILGTSDSIRDESPFENVKAFFDAGRKYGTYL
jgi:uroporphyrinogen-III decarboxylase